MIHNKITGKELVGKSILVVEDEPLLRDLTAEELSIRGARVAVAGNVDGAMIQLKKSVFDAVVSDLNMPGGDGFCLQKKISEELSYKPMIIIISGYLDDQKKNAHSDIFTALFSKPTDWDQVVDVISSR